jgi:hypothetical protein
LAHTISSFFDDGRGGIGILVAVHHCGLSLDFSEALQG